MTVSPQWPQDGNRPPSDVSGGVDSDESCRSPALPPTLFRLPNLNPVSSEQEQEAPSPTPTPIKGQPQTAAQAAPSSAVPAPPTGAPERSSPTESSDSDPQSPTPPAVAATPAPTRHASTSDRPAGRSWVEAVGSHGVVVVLLLVVIAAALVTGRRTRHRETDATLAEHRDLLNFEDGEKIELPIPDHGPQPTPELARSESTDSAEDTLAFENYPASTNSGQVQRESTSTSISSQYEFAEAATNIPVDAAADSVATLDTPLADPDVTETAGSDPYAQFQAHRVQVNEFVSGVKNVDVFAASSRIPEENVDSTLPSLEDLADEPATATAAQIAKPIVTRPLLSSMPKEIKNLLQYLPDPQQATAVPVDAEIPTTSE